MNNILHLLILNMKGYDRDYPQYNNNNNNNIYLKSNIHSITRYKFSRLYKNMVSTI